MLHILHLIFLYLLLTATAIEPALNRFQVAFQWTRLNFTWQSPQQYQQAIANGSYIPENVCISGIKIYQDRLYLAIPTTLRPGVPVTLGSISLNGSVTDQLVEPFPDWNAGSLLNGNVGNCDVEQGVTSMEIDPDGIMWVLDGTRNASSQCPNKLTLYDLQTRNKIFTYNFPEEVSSSTTGFLDDIVLDGNYAYITEASSVDPGLIVYSKVENRSWKLRDRTMFAERGAETITVDGVTENTPFPIDGIALSPRNLVTRNVYYCAVAGYNLYSIDVTVLQNQTLFLDGGWRDQVRFVGRKIAQTDPLTIDNRGNMYFGLLPLYSVAKWNIETSFLTARIIDTNPQIMTWTDSLAFDNTGYLFMLASNIEKYFSEDNPLKLDDTIKFRILKYFTNTQSYLY